MTNISPLEALPFSEAKARLSELMTSVVHDHHLHLIDRHGGKERMVLVSADDFSALVSTFRFAPAVSFSEGEFVMQLPELGLISGGETFDEAVDEMVALVQSYAALFFSRLEFYRHTDKARHLPWLARFALTPAEQRRDILLERPDSAADAA